MTSLAEAWPRDLLDCALLAMSSVDSTQRLARALVERQLAEDESPPACCLIALEQTAGRGRRGRGWDSAVGLGLWATVVSRVGSETLGSLPLRTAVALAEALTATVPALRLKWPNDLLAQGRKLGGVLVEAISRDRSTIWAMIGFGINLEHGERDLPNPGAVSLRLLEVAAAERRLERIAPRLVGEVRREAASPRSGWLEKYRERSIHRPGDRIECDLEGERVAGEVIGFDEHGGLRLRTSGGERTIVAGDVYSW